MVYLQGEEALFPYAMLQSKPKYFLTNNQNRKVRSSEDLKNKKLALYIYLDGNVRAKGFLYFNDGYSTLYK